MVDSFVMGSARYMAVVQTCSNCSQLSIDFGAELPAFIKFPGFVCGCSQELEHCFTVSRRSNGYHYLVLPRTLPAKPLRPRSSDFFLPKATSSVKGICAIF